MDWYDKEGQPISIEEWERLHSDMDYIRVGTTDVGPYWVSTVWLGLDHSWMEGSPPIIFETMVFLKGQRDDPEDRGLADIDVVRYSTLQQAQEGHQAMVLLVQATTVEEPPQGPSDRPTGGSGVSDGPDVAYLVARMP